MSQTQLWPVIVSAGLVRQVRRFLFKQRNAFFVREVFPNTLLAKPNLDTFTLTINSYVDPSQEEYFADIVYTCRYEGEKPVEIAILFEHKSYYATCLIAGKKAASRTNPDVGDSGHYLPQ